MSTTTRFMARILSALLTVTLLFTSGVTPIFAAEINNQLLTARPFEFAANAADAIKEDEIPYETIKALLERIDEYETFTRDERALLYQYLNIGYDEEEAQFATAKAETAFFALNFLACIKNFLFHSFKKIKLFILIGG